MLHPPRAWLADLTEPNGLLVDAVRRFHEEDAIYTCALPLSRNLECAKADV